jgi:hypothetical protein
MATVSWQTGHSAKLVPGWQGHAAAPFALFEVRRFSSFFLLFFFVNTAGLAAE